MNLITRPVKSYIYVGIQFLCLGFIISSGPWVARAPIFFLLEMCGGLLGVWALFTMKLRNLSALPEVKFGSTLKTEGSYQWIRHPMYLALLLVMLALVCEYFTYWRGLIWLVLFIDLLLKLHYEEQLLLEAFSEYRNYQMRTHKLIPWIF